MEYSLTQVATISFSKNILLWVSNFRYYSRKLILFLSLWQKKECNINLQEYSFIVSYWTSENLFTFGIYMWKYSTGLLTACEQDQDGTSWSCSQAVSKTVWYVPLLCVQWKTPDGGQRIRMEHPDPARKLSAKLYDIYHCCVYSEKLLMVDRGTVPNM